MDIVPFAQGQAMARCVARSIPWRATERTPTWLIFHAIREHIKIWQGNLLSHGKIKPPNYEKQDLSSPFPSMSNKNNEWEF